MPCATAANTASVQFTNSFILIPIASMPAGRLVPYVMPDRQLSDTKQEKDIHEVHPISAMWFNAVQRRIRNSTAPPGRKVETDGRWLSQGVADAASSFFTTTSDVLPNEPYIYRSLKGDFVAEFSSAHGTMTNIVSETSVIVFAVVDGAPTEKRFSLGRRETDALRQELHRITKLLLAGLHGTQVESEN
jgi:hypothetical protein